MKLSKYEDKLIVSKLWMFEYVLESRAPIGNEKLVKFSIQLLVMCVCVYIVDFHLVKDTNSYIFEFYYNDKCITSRYLIQHDFIALILWLGYKYRTGDMKFQMLFGVQIKSSSFIGLQTVCKFGS